MKLISGVSMRDDAKGLGDDSALPGLEELSREELIGLAQRLLEANAALEERILAEADEYVGAAVGDLVVMVAMRDCCWP